MKIDQKKIPKHVAIIMDGNGRWAKKRGLPKIAGHGQGVKTVEKIIAVAKKHGVRVLSLYAFSTENWKRPKKEVDGLMNLLENYLEKQALKLQKEGVRLSAIGDIEGLPASVSKKLKEVIELTKSNTSFTLNIALNYGARMEIVEATKSILKDIQRGALNIENLTEKVFSRYLYTKNLTDPDLLIRTSGEMRVSNFLLWQIAYTEFYITEKFWPDFTEKDFEKAIGEFQKRERRFGGR